MRIMLLGLLALMLPVFAFANEGEAKGEAAAAAATVDTSADETYWGLNMPCECAITCVQVDLDCCCVCDDPGGSADSLWIDFLGADGAVLGSAELKGPWCDPCACSDEHFGTLDKAVNPQDVCSMRISKPGEDDLSLDFISVHVMSESQGCDCCTKTKWHKVWKCGDLCCSTLTGKQAWLVQ